MAKPKLDINSFVLGEEETPQETTAQEEAQAEPAEEQEEIAEGQEEIAEEQEEEEPQEEQPEEVEAEQDTEESEEEEDAIDTSLFVKNFYQSKGEEIDEETFSEKFKDIDFSSFEGLNEWMEREISERSKPVYRSEEEQRFAEYLANGGKPEDYAKVYYNEEADYENFEIKSPTDQKKVLMDYYKRTTKFSDDKISKFIKALDDAGEIEDEAKSALDELKQFQEEDKQQLLEQQRKQKEEQKKQEEQLREELKSQISEKDKIASLPFSKKERDGFYEFLTKPDKDGLTAYQRMYQEDPFLQVELAALAYKQVHKGKSKAAQTEATKKLRKQLNKMSTVGSRRGQERDVKHPERQDSKQQYNSFILN